MRKFRLNVYSDDYGMCLAQKFIDEKTNEIPAAQELLRLMDLKGTIVTADAMNCQKGTAEVIIDRKGDYVLALKGNQGVVRKKVEDSHKMAHFNKLPETGNFLESYRKMVTIQDTLSKDKLRTP